VIALLDYGSGNLRSVYRALQKVGADVRLVTQPGEMREARGLVLPGVGAFDDCLNAIQKQELLEETRRFVDEGRPFLGICVGYQALFERSEEFNSRARGLGLFPGAVVRFPTQPGLKVPQIGWNQVRLTRPECPLYRGIPDGAYFYFVHSYYPETRDPGLVSTWTDYGSAFASSIWRDHVFGTQFHPEKSQQAGLKLLSNFVALTR
jgi:glutamine amidotransferase